MPLSTASPNEKRVSASKYFNEPVKVQGRLLGKKARFTTDNNGFTKGQRSGITQISRFEKVAYSETPHNELSSHLVREDTKKGVALSGNNEILRMHRMQVKYYLREHLTPKEPGLLIRYTDIPFVERQGFRNHNDILIANFQDLSIILSPRSVIISGITVSMPLNSPKTTYDMLETALLMKIQPGIEDLEFKIMKRYPRFRILRNARGFMAGEIIQNEIAVEHDAIAENVKIHVKH